MIDISTVRPLLTRSLLLAALAFTTFSCNPTSSGATEGGIISGAVNKRNKLREDKQENEDKLKGSLVARMGDAKARTGETVCLPVELSNVNQLIGLQYTMRFDSAALRFTSVRNFGLPGYGTANFGVRFAERGVVSTLWHDPSLKGVTKAADTKAFEICFENLQPKGQSTEIRFSDGPTSFEVIQADMQQLRFVYANGRVTSR
jgi:hypothetical protein